MATSTNFLLKEMSGALGKQLVIKQYYDKVVIARKPDMSKRKLSKKQKENNDLMKEANIYAKGHYYNQEARAAAELRLKLHPKKSLFHALVREFIESNKTEK